MIEHEAKDTAPGPPPPGIETLIARALRLRCPRCGEGALFSGWFTMPERCTRCRLKFERAPGYFLGSTYINYAMTAGFLTVAYMVMHYGLLLTNRQLAGPLMAFCIGFPLASFRYARALWLSLDCHFDASVLRSED